MASLDGVPRWFAEGGEPAFATDDAHHQMMLEYSGRKFLWRNTHAIHIVKMQQNEGTDYKEDLRLLSAGERILSPIGSFW